MTQSAETPVPFEKALEQLQLSVKRLESGELSLEDALKCFEEGVKLTRICQEQLKAAEQRIEVLVNSQSGAPTDAPRIESFDPTAQRK